MKQFLISCVVVAIIVVLFVIWYGSRNQAVVIVPVSVPTPVATSTSPTTSTPPISQSISDGVITLTYAPSQFSLATTTSQVSVKSVIPPCDEGFDYCIYYSSSTYQGTNLESAGVTVNNRTDLVTEAECLNTGPNGYSGLTPVILPPNALSSTAPVSPLDYATSIFAGVGNAAAGSYATENVYRLWYKGSPGVRAGCYEFETRIGQSEFGNHPPGSIQQFTAGDQSTVQAWLDGIVQSVTLPSGEQAQFPTAQASTSGK